MSTSNTSSEIYAVADFCLIPMGLESPSVGPQIAECQRVLEKSGLEYHVSHDVQGANSPFWLSCLHANSSMDTVRPGEIPPEPLLTMTGMQVPMSRDRGPK